MIRNNPSSCMFGKIDNHADCPLNCFGFGHTRNGIEKFTNLRHGII